MPYDEDLAHRIRELLAEEPGLSEKSMFGGLAFLLDGKMALAASSRGGLMVRVGAEAAEKALSRTHARAIDMRGRTMTGWVYVEPPGLRTKRSLASWVGQSVAFTRTLAPKGPAARVSG
jgi:TfoX/Sxy family transcriptional regulator of competence genes